MDRLPFTPTRVIFFTGKGGVGKTSLACATAVTLADAGRRVLLVSTDPASNLDEVLGVRLRNQPTEVPHVNGLAALNIDPDVAAREYRERLVGPYRDVLPPATIARMEEQLSGGCTIEIAAFDQFTSLLGQPAATSQYDHVIFDTAPTGHTLRLLKLPAAWTGFIDTNTTETSCLGPLSGLRAKVELYRASLKALADPTTTTIVLVSRPETAALAEAARTGGELADLGITHQRLIINGVFHARDRQDPIARAVETRGRDALLAMPARLTMLTRTDVPLLAHAPLGVDGLRTVFGDADTTNAQSAFEHVDRDELPDSLSALVEEIAVQGRGVILTMGKGGVGKTTVAAAIAVQLAERGHDVVLSTTDPAAHVADVVGGVVERLYVSCIDPAAEVAAYTAEVIASSGASLDARGLDLLKEDLRSPCTQEIAVFRAFARTVADGQHGFVVLDTAPTGHTILLLDAAEAYHREVERTQGDVPDAVRDLLPRLRDPLFTKVILVTIPEATPVHEAAELQEDLRRAGIEPFAWVVNQSFAGDEVRDPVLRERGKREHPYLEEVRDQLATRVAWAPWYAAVPVGRGRLLEFSTDKRQVAGAAER